VLSEEPPYQGKVLLVVPEVLAHLAAAVAQGL
jgi:hypothetical protein